MRRPLFLFIATLFSLFLYSSCATEPADPTLALPANAGLIWYWQQGSTIPPTGFAGLDEAVRELAVAVPTKDSLESVPYAAFAYNLRPGELAAGLAVATAKIAPWPGRRADFDYRGVSLFRIDSTRLLYATYEDLSLVAREAVIIQEMIDQLAAGKPGGLVEVPSSDVQVLQYRLPELSALFSSQTTERSRAQLNAWAGDWSTVSLRFQNDTLRDWRLTTEATLQPSVATACLPSIPAGIEHFAVLPLPQGVNTQPNARNWSTYFAPWLGKTYARLDTNDGSILAFCPRDERLMQDLLDRLEREFAVADRIQYPSGTIYRTEATGILPPLLSPASAEIWLLRTKEYTYLADNRTALEKLLDLQMLAGPQTLPEEIRGENPPPVVLARLNAERLSGAVGKLFAGWSAPEWWPGLAGWWSGAPGPTGLTLRRHAGASPVAADSTLATRPTTEVAWRWEAPTTIEGLIPVPGASQCAVYLEDGTLVVLNDRQEEQVRFRLGAFPNSPVYHLPSTSSSPTRWLFSTPTAVYLIDTSGQTVAGFPYRPPGGLAAGVALDDLDRATNPAYFVPLRSGRIEAYSLRGMPLVNWTVPTDFCAAAPLLTLHSDTSTYLAVMDTLARVRIFDRRGTAYRAFDSLPNPFISPLFGQLSAGTGPGRLTALELDGRIRVMSLAGGNFPLRTLLANGAPRQFLFIDLWGDNRKDYLVSRETAVALYAYENTNFAQRWQTRFPGAVDGVFALPSLQLVGGVDRDRGLIYLLNGGDGKILNEQALAGRLPAQELPTSDGGQTLLITAYNRTLYAYRRITGKSY